MKGRVRLWVFGKLGFVEGQVIDASAHGLRMKVSAALPTTLLHHGDRHRLEVSGRAGDTFSATAEIRHVTDRGVGLRVDDCIPLEFFAVDDDPESAR